MCDPSCASESIELFKDNYLLTKESMEWFWEKFKNNDEDHSKDTFNLLLFNPNRDFPKTIIVTAGLIRFQMKQKNMLFYFMKMLVM